jgi:formate/nitrite transporter FocA (FNT family)
MEEIINKKYFEEAEEIRNNVAAIKNKKMKKKNLKKFKGAMKGGRMMAMKVGRMNMRGSTKKPKKKIRKPIEKKIVKKKITHKARNKKIGKNKKKTTSRIGRRA